LKRVPILLISILIVVLELLTVSCGGGSANCGTSTTAACPVPVNQRPSGLAKRVFVANKNSTVNIVDANLDVLSFTAISGITTPQYFIRGGGANTIGVMDNTAGSVTLIDTDTEAVTQSVSLQAPSDSVVLTNDGNWAYAAFNSIGEVVAISVTGSVSNVTFSGLSGARRLVLSNSNNKVLVFRDNSTSMSIIDVATNVATPVTIAASLGAFQLDNPYTGVFSSDDTKAYILSCGSECGGTQASVSVLDIASATITGTVNVDAATAAILDSTGANLYVVGSLNNVGKINVVSISALTATHLAVSLPNGLHTASTMAMTSNGKIYIGSTGCTTTGAINAAGSTGCLAVFTIAGNSVTTLANLGNVTSVEPISGRMVMYVTSGGELYIYNYTTDTLQATQIDIIGLAQDARLIDK